jgi:uncharacterized protein (TIGR03086 family)
MTDTTDPRPLHRRAIAQTESIVAAVSPAQLALPTPCSAYDVRALLSHIVGGLNRVAIMGEGGAALARTARALSTPGRTTAQRPPAADGVPDDGWPAAYRAAGARAVAAWTDDAKLDALVEVPWGKVASCPPSPAVARSPSAPRSRPPLTRAPTPS